MRYPLISLLAAVTAFVSSFGISHADVLLDSTRLIALPTVAAPAEFPFTTSAAAAMTVTLTDFQQPAAFSTLQIAVTLGDTLVGTAEIVPPATTATVAIPAAIGNYVLHVVGTPNATQTVGTFGACVSLNSDPNHACIAADSFSGNIQTPSTPSTSASSGLQANFTSTSAGTYVVNITDDAFPVALQSVAGGLSQGSSIVNTTSFSLGANQVTLAAGTVYTLTLGALADATLQAGLYGVHIVDPSGNAVFDRTVPVGTLAAATTVSNPASQTVGLSLTDLMYPAAFASVGVAVSSGSALVATLTTPGTVASATAPAGNLQVWQYSLTSGQPGVYSVNLAPTSGGAALFAKTQVVNPPASASPTSYAFVVDLPASGTYNVAATDFQFPADLATGPTAVVAQNGAVLTQTNGAFTASAGNLVVVVSATAPSGASGIFDVTVTGGGSAPQVFLDQTQAVGATFTTDQMSVTTAGSYDVTLTDLGFPANFASLAVVVSQGGTVLGKIFGGGTFAFSGSTGSYVLTYIDTPSATASSATTTPGYGLYSVQVQSTAPTVTLSSSASSVVTGQSVTLTWSTTNATACTASGAASWTGSEQVSGTASVTIDSTESLTLSCTGPGGAASQSVNVTATQAPAKSGGGGLDWTTLVLLGLVALARRRSGLTQQI